MHHLSVSLAPNLGKTLQSPQSELTPWTLTLSYRLETPKVFGKLSDKLENYHTETAEAKGDDLITPRYCTLLILIDFCPVYCELFTWSSVTETYAILPAYILEYQI